MIENSDMRLLLTTSGLVPQTRAPELRTVVTLDDAEARAAFEAAAGPDHGVDVRPDDPILMLYTSGTTSRPRGCVHDHASLVAEGEAVAERLGLGPADRFWTPLPMFHCGAYDVAMAALAGRSGMVHAGAFEPGAALR